MLGITNVSNAPSIILRGKIVSSWSNLPTTSGSTDYDMYQQGYTYYASITEAGTMENSIAEVTFSDTDAKSGNYAPVCRTYAGEIRVYSKVNTSITIPSIVIHSTVETYNYTLDSGPVEGSTKAVMSGGVYDALANKEDKITVTAGSYSINTSALSSGNITWSRAGNLVTITCSDIAFTTTGYNIPLTTATVPKPKNGFVQVALIGALGEARGLLQMTTQYGLIANYGQATGILNYGSITYITDDT